MAASGLRACTSRSTIRPVRLLALLLLATLAAVTEGRSRKASTPPFTCDAWSNLCTKNPDGSFSLSCLNGNVGAMGSSLFYYYGTFSVQLKFPKGYSGGIIFAYYLIDPITTSNTDPHHAEIDSEFYGSTNSSSIMLATNVFCGGKQNLAQFQLPFDLGDGWHTYSMQWNYQTIVWRVDGQILRILQRGGPGTTPLSWPQRPMQVRFSVWQSSWTALKADFSKGPITLQVRNPTASGCATRSPTSWDPKCVNRKSGVLSWNQQPFIPPNKASLPAGSADSFVGYHQIGTVVGAWGWGPA